MLRPAVLIALPALLVQVPAGAAAAPSLALAGVAEPSPVAVGDDQALVLSVSNTGDRTATGVQVVVNPPIQAVYDSASASCSGEGPVTCPVGDLPPGATAEVRVLAGVIAPGELTWEADASAQPSAESPAPEPAHATVRGRADGRACETIGTPEADMLTGAGVICGLGGDDDLTGSRGRDRLLGGSGDDLLRGGRGPDRLDGGEGRDTAVFDRAVTADLGRGLAHGEGRDRLERLEGLLGSPGDDVLIGSDRGDTLAGGAGSDLLSGGKGPDDLDGGPGRDACDQGGGRGPVQSCEASPFARDAAITLFELSRGTVGYGYHQSLFGAARPLAPVRTGDPTYVMSSRGRGTGATTAVDVVVPSGSAVLAPVTGRVVAVQRYLLYCAFLDWKVVIAPRERPDLRVMVLHMANPRVRPGAIVAAGATVIGVAAGNDLASSQANHYFPDQYPHVHVEIERGYAPTPGCSL